ncbi:hypothetical protein IHE45_13G025100 [Dioscorea alata]|uniref:Uncharacterized protein n=1 Tax=Dioscorea alata TaxID=55571 RepID=A0ACB7UWX3_DIOAL|nr:hypothetical protein IHE45_13G025100 [Dioscorea alata]
MVTVDHSTSPISSFISEDFSTSFCLTFSSISQHSPTSMVPYFSSASAPAVSSSSPPTPPPKSVSPSTTSSSPTAPVSSPGNTLDMTSHFWFGPPTALTGVTYVAYPLSNSSPPIVSFPPPTSAPTRFSPSSKPSSVTTPAPASTTPS